MSDGISDGSTTESECFDEEDALSDVDADDERDASSTSAMTRAVAVDVAVTVDASADWSASTSTRSHVPAMPDSAAHRPRSLPTSRKRMRSDDGSSVDTPARPCRRQVIAEEPTRANGEPQKAEEEEEEEEEPIELPLLSSDDDDDSDVQRLKTLSTTPAPRLQYAPDPQCPRCHAPVLHRDASDMMPRECWAQCICCRVAMIRTAFPSSEWGTSAPRCVYCSRFQDRVGRARPHRSVFPWRQSRDDFRRASAVALQLTNSFHSSHASSPMDIAQHPMLLAIQSQLQTLERSVDDTLKDLDDGWFSTRADIPPTVRFELEEEQARLERMETKLRQLLVLVCVQLLERHGVTSLPADVETVVARMSKKAQRAIVHRAADVCRHKVHVVLTPAARKWLRRVNDRVTSAESRTERVVDAVHDTERKPEGPTIASAAAMKSPTPDTSARGPRRVPLLFSRPSVVPVVARPSTVFGASMAAINIKPAAVSQAFVSAMKPRLVVGPQSLPSPATIPSPARSASPAPQVPVRSVVAVSQVPPASLPPQHPRSTAIFKAEQPTSTTVETASGSPQPDHNDSSSDAVVARPHHPARRCLSCAGFLLHRDCNGIVSKGLLRRCSCCRSHFTCSVFSKPQWRSKNDETRLCCYCTPEHRQTDSTAPRWRERLVELRVTCKAAANTVNALTAAPTDTAAFEQLKQAHDAVEKRMQQIGSMRYILKKCIPMIEGDKKMAGIEFEMKEELYRLQRLELDERLKQVIVLGEMLVATSTDVPSDVQAFVDAAPEPQRTLTIQTATRDVLAVTFRMSYPAMSTMKKLEKQRKKEARRKAHEMRTAREAAAKAAAPRAAPSHNKLRAEKKKQKKEARRKALKEQAAAERTRLIVTAAASPP